MTDTNKPLPSKPIRIPGKRLIITKRMILGAIEVTKSNAEAARWLGIDPNTYKKYATLYGVYEQHMNQAGLGITKGGWSNYDIPLDDIFEGKTERPYPIRRFKRRLIEDGYMVEECSVCGWNEQNISTKRICLTLDYIDDNKHNLKPENLRFLCPNCYYSHHGKFLSSSRFCV